MYEWLKNLFEWLLSGLKNFFVALWDSFIFFLSGLGQLIFDSISWFFTSFGEFVFEGAIVLINKALGTYDSSGRTVEWSREVWTTINFFVPLDLLFSLSAALFAFWICVLCTKIVLKLIPTVY